MAIATGCGDSSDGSEPALTKAEYIKQGNAICKKGVEERIAVSEDVFKEHTKNGKLELTQAEEEDLVSETTLPPVRKAVEELAALAPPEGEEDTVNAIVEGFEEAVEAVEEDPGSVLGSGDSPFAEPTEKAGDYGLQPCVSLS
ncbi:MAG TPA: hypothetical protein VFR04_09335 [Solirubrobacterales bacterium]|nr:hypothetical protein [Solirubrobacterales bacterium]